MNAKFSRKKLSIKPSARHGYGVFAGEHIHKGEMIEECHRIEVREIKTEAGYNFWNKYSFEAENPKESVISLGFGSIYNHSNSPNADFNHHGSLIIFKSLRDIQIHEEILVSYGENWFASRNQTLLDNLPRNDKKRLIRFQLFLLRFVLIATAIIGMAVWLH